MRGQELTLYERDKIEFFLRAQRYPNHRKDGPSEPFDIIRSCGGIRVLTVSIERQKPTSWQGKENGRNGKEHLRRMKI